MLEWVKLDRAVTNLKIADSRSLECCEDAGRMLVESERPHQLRQN